MFLDCLFEQDYRRLIIEGDAYDETLINTWQNLYAEYCQLMHADHFSDHTEILKECNTAIATIHLVDAIVTCLRSFYDPELVDILNELGLKPGISCDDSFEVITTKLVKVKTRAKKFVVDYEARKKQLANIEKNNEKKKGGREDYESLLSAIAKEQGYHIKPADITVAWFCRQCQKIKEASQKKFMQQQKM